MLGVMSKGLGLPEPIMRVSDPSWVVAETMHIGEGMTVLSIYRSTWLRDTDEAYEQVQTLLERSEHEEIYRASREDEAMMHGRGEWIIYMLNPVPNPGPIARKLIAFTKHWGEPMSPIEAVAEASARLHLLEGVR